MERELRVLFVEDREEDALLIARELRRGGYQVTHERVDTAAAMQRALERPWDIVISDYSMPRFGGVAALEVLKESGQDLPFILVSGAIGEDVAVESLKAGAHDFIPKSNLKRLVPAVERELKDAVARRERARAQEQLRESTEALAAVFTASPLPIIVLDDRGHLLRWNAAAERTFGWTAAEVLGQPLPTVPPEEMPAFNCRLQRVLSGEALSTGEVPRLRKDGAQLNVTVSAAPLRAADGTTTSLMAIYTDLTEHKRLEEQFRQAQKMEAVGRLAGGIAHDFNNVLTAITGYATLVLEELPKDDSRRDDIQEILNAAGRAGSFTRQLLAFSRKQVVQLELVEPDSVITEVQNLLRRVAGEQVELKLKLKARGRRVLADRGQIGQVVMNLVVNARDAMQRGTIEISTRETTVTHDPTRKPGGIAPGNYFLLEVADTGTGIPPEIMDQIFEPFFTTKEAGKGTGLGLSTVYGIVKQSGGGVVVRSKVGAGTTFCIYLPLSADQIAEPEPTETERSGGDAAVSGAHILVVDDDAVVRGLMRRSLTRAGFQVTATEHASTALDHLRSGRRVDLLLTDVMLGETSGRDLVEQAVRIRPDLRYMYTSGYTEHELSLPPGTGFLEKPFAPDDLLRKVSESLGAINPTV